MKSSYHRISVFQKQIKTSFINCILRVYVNETINSHMYVLKEELILMTHENFKLK